ncbi:histidine--tRNA ligase, partial [bacterium]|nr:histidine--tRNA ligase [bacterium]
EIDLTNKKFTKQLEKASKIANYAIILGEDEIEKNKVSVKNLKTGEQITIDRKDMAENIK